MLYSAWRGKWTKPEVDALLEGIGLTGMVRAEAMNVDEFLTLADALKARFGRMDTDDDPEDEPKPDDDGASSDEDDRPDLDES